MNIYIVFTKKCKICTKNEQKNVLLPSTKKATMTENKVSIADFNKDIFEIFDNYLNQKDVIEKLEKQVTIMKNILKKNVKSTTDFKYYKTWRWNQLVEEYKENGFEDEEINKPLGWIMLEIVEKINNEFKIAKNDEEKMKECKNAECNKHHKLIDELLKE